MSEELGNALPHHIAKYGAHESISYCLGEEQRSHMSGGESKAGVDMYLALALCYRAEHGVEDNQCRNYHRDQKTAWRFRHERDCHCCVDVLSRTIVHRKGQHLHQGKRSLLRFLPGSGTHGQAAQRPAGILDKRRGQDHELIAGYGRHVCLRCHASTRSQLILNTSLCGASVLQNRQIPRQQRLPVEHAQILLDFDPVKRVKQLQIATDNLEGFTGGNTKRRCLGHGNIASVASGKTIPACKVSAWDAQSFFFPRQAKRAFCAKLFAVSGITHGYAPRRQRLVQPVALGDRTIGAQKVLDGLDSALVHWPHARQPNQDTGVGCFHAAQCHLTPVAVIGR